MLRKRTSAPRSFEGSAFGAPSTERHCSSRVKLSACHHPNKMRTTNFWGSATTRILLCSLMFLSWNLSDAHIAINDEVFYNEQAINLWRYPVRVLPSVSYFLFSRIMGVLPDRYWNGHLHYYNATANATTCHPDMASDNNHTDTTASSDTGWSHANQTGLPVLPYYGDQGIQSHFLLAHLVPSSFPECNNTDPFVVDNHTHMTNDSHDELFNPENDTQVTMDPLPRRLLDIAVAADAINARFVILIANDGNDGTTLRQRLHFWWTRHIQLTTTTTSSTANEQTTDTDDDSNHTIKDHRDYSLPSSDELYELSDYLNAILKDLCYRMKDPPRSETAPELFFLVVSSSVGTALLDLIRLKTQYWKTMREYYNVQSMSGDWTFVNTILVGIDDRSMETGRDLVINGSVYFLFVILVYILMKHQQGQLDLSHPDVTRQRQKLTVEDLSEGIVQGSIANATPNNKDTDSLHHDDEALPNASTDDHDSVVEQDCAICLDKMSVGATVKIFPCRHFFHEECIASWFVRSKHTCPLCKFDLRRHLLEQDKARRDILQSQEVDNRRRIQWPSVLRGSMRWNRIQTDDNHLLEDAGEGEMVLGDLELTEEISLSSVVSQNGGRSSTGGHVHDDDDGGGAGVVV